MVEVDIVTTMGPEGTASPFTEVPTRLVNWSEAVMVTVSAWIARADTVAIDLTVDITVTMLIEAEADDADEIEALEADVLEGADRLVVVVESVSVIVTSASDSSVSPMLTVRVPLGGKLRVMRVAVGLGLSEDMSSSSSACLACLTSETSLQRGAWWPRAA